MSTRILLINVSLAMMVTGCSGFHLQGSQSSQKIRSNNTLIDNVSLSEQLDPSKANSIVTIQTSKGLSSKGFKRQLINNLNNFGIQTIDSRLSDETNNTSINDIKISNVSFREYDLLGVLTEVSVVILADVTYLYTINGKQKTHYQPIQVQRNYQNNKASVGTINQQQQQIKIWLYDTLAQRITNQYVALSQNNK